MVIIHPDIGKFLFAVQRWSLKNQYTIIPNNFEHKKSALFFSSLKELKDIIEYYFIEGNEEELLKIAENGRRHLLQYHTPQHRANYVMKA
jgi:spore maturation protein CgeB